MFSPILPSPRNSKLCLLDFGVVFSNTLQGYVVASIAASHPIISVRQSTMILNSASRKPVHNPFLDMGHLSFKEFTRSVIKVQIGSYFRSSQSIRLALMRSLDFENRLGSVGCPLKILLFLSFAMWTNFSLLLLPVIFVKSRTDCTDISR